MLLLNVWIKNNYHNLYPRYWPIKLRIITLLIFLRYYECSWWKIRTGQFLFPKLFLYSLILLLIARCQWFLDIRVEGFMGYHTKNIELILTCGILLFIISEIILFSSFFWTYFYLSFIPSRINIIKEWPPYTFLRFDPWGIPFKNTCILLTSGFLLTRGHRFFLKNNIFLLKTFLLIRILLGIIFIMFQIFEYKGDTLSIFNCDCFKRIFYITTRFHGFHVLVGILFLASCYFRIISGLVRVVHNLGLVFASWYWHFVDIIWLILFLSYYLNTNINYFK